MLLALTMLAVTPTTRAQPSKVPWPAKPIRVVVPYPAGGNADLIARLLSNKLAARLDTTVIVENRPGASGMIGADSVAKATPDGYTLLFTVVSQLVVPPLGVKPPYDPFKDFRPLAGVSMNPLILVGSPAAGAKNLTEMMALARKKKISYGSYGEGTTTHLLLHAMGQTHKLDMAHVPYRGEAPMIGDLLGGHIQMGMVSIAVAHDYLASGRMIPLATVADERSTFLPQVGTTAEQGAKDMSWLYRLAYFAPAALPDPIATRLTDELLTVAKSEEVTARLRTLYHTPWGAQPAEISEVLRQDAARYAQLLEQVK